MKLLIACIAFELVIGTFGLVALGVGRPWFWALDVAAGFGAAGFLSGLLVEDAHASKSNGLGAGS